MQKQFLSLLLTLAQACKFELSKDLMAVYDAAAEQKGYEAACGAIKHFLINRRTNDPFPSVRDLMEKLDPTLLPLLPEDESRLAASRAITAVRKYGRVNPAQARIFIGELGWKGVEEMGGWSSFCAALTVNNLSTYQRELTNLCLSIFRRSQRGLTDFAPKLPGRMMPAMK